MAAHLHMHTMCMYFLPFVFIVFIRQQSIAWANVDQDLCRHMALLDPNKYQAIEIDVVYFANIFTKSFESEVNNLLVQSNTIQLTQSAFIITNTATAKLCWYL